MNHRAYFGKSLLCAMNYDPQFACWDRDRWVHADLLRTHFDEPDSLRKAGGQDGHAKACTRRERE